MHTIRNAIVTEEIQKELKCVEDKLQKLKIELSLAEKRKETLLLQASCKDHGFVPDPFPSVYFLDTCSKCGRSYVY